MSYAKRPAVDISAATEIDWARLAAFIDGEGHVGIGYAVHKDPKFEGARQKYEYVRVSICNTDARLIEWLAANFGGSVRTRTQPRNTKWKTGFWWIVSSRQACALLERCLPHFILKRERAELALALQATMNRCGRRGTPQTVIDKRTAIKARLHVLNAKGPVAVNE